MLIHKGYTKQSLQRLYHCTDMYLKKAPQNKKKYIRMLRYYFKVFSLQRSLRYQFTMLTVPQKV